MGAHATPKPNHARRLAAAAPVTERMAGDPYVYDVYGLYQCGTVSLSWFGDEPPFTVTIYVLKDTSVSRYDETLLEPWVTLARNTTTTSASWEVNVPDSWAVAVGLVDSQGKNYTTYPKLVGTTSDTSCLPYSLQSPRVTQDVVYNYNFNNGSRLVTSIVLSSIICGVSLIVILIVICCCVRRNKKRNKERLEREATQRPMYAQFVPHPGAEPVLYVQLTPGAPFVPAGATPEAARGAPLPLAATGGLAPQATEAEGQVPLSRSASPAMSMAPNAAPVTGSISGSNAVAFSGGSNAEASSSGTSPQPEPPLAPPPPAARGFNPRGNASATSLTTTGSRS